MANVFKSLEDVSKGYKIFEKDQVLTEEQLNRLADYLDDQERLTRVALLGVGIFCGLRATVTDAGVVLTKGVGVTTDGDLLRVPADLTYKRFRVYDQTAPVYTPFFDGANMRKVYELTGGDVNTAATLDTFPAQAQKKLTDMTAVLLMESFIKDGDLCTGGDCDNKGKDAISNVKLLLLDPKDIAALQESLPTLDAVARDKLEPIVADRVQLGDGINSAAALAQAYRAACTNTLNRLKPALAKMVAECASFLGDLFPADPVPAWTARLNPPAADAATQYYYDFLKDVVETYNAFRDALFGDTSVCCPPLAAFSKHLLLGAATGAGSLADDANRTGFYPSPLARARTGTLDHARSLARKIDTIIASFKPVIEPATAIIVTPSHGEDRSLEERAIPGYYAVDMAARWPIHRAWSYSLERRAMAAFNYSARAKEYGGKGAALAPLTAQIGQYSFFRIEGHLGHPIAAAVADIEKAIATNNLPFVVRAVLLGAERPKIVVKPPIRYTHLHRLHYLVRQDLSQQLDDVMAHNDTFKKEVDAAIDKKLVSDAQPGAGVPSIKTFAAQKQAGVADAAGKAKAKLNQGYADYKKAPAWQGDMKQTVTHATELKFHLGDVARTEFATPVDSLVTNNHMLWVDWLDRIIQTHDDKEDDKLIYANFIKDHPAAEHFAGVPRGGTFVLVYDGNGTVVADLTLPYWWPEHADAPPAEPPLPRPDIKPPIVIDKGVRILPALDNLIEERVNVRLVDFKAVNIDPLAKQTLDFPKNYVQAFKDSVDLMGSVVPRGAGPGVPTGPVVKDPRLDIQVRDMQAKAGKVDQLRKMIMDPAIDAPKRTELEGQLKSAERELSTAIIDSSKYIATADIDARTDGVAAMAVVSDAFSKLGNEAATTVANRVKADVDAAGAAAKPQAKTMITGVLRGRGFTG